MQMVLLALEANKLEQLILNVQNLENLLACDAITHRLELNKHWQMLDRLMQNDSILKEVFHPIHPLTHHPLAAAEVHYNTVVRVADVYEALNNLDIHTFLQAQYAASVKLDESILADLRLDFNQIQRFYYHAADQNLVVVAVQGEHLFATSYF